MSVCTIALNRCPHGVEMLSLEYREHGSRFAGSKCCGKWTVVKSWAVRASDLRDIADNCEANEEEFERASGARAETKDEWLPNRA